MPTSHRCIGEILIEMGLLTESQVHSIIAEQQSTGEVFGMVAERMYGVSQRDLWRAWGEQMRHYCPRVDLSRQTITEAGRKSISMQQALQLRVVPLDCDEERWLVATTEANLAEVYATLQEETELTLQCVIAPGDQIDKALAELYGQADADRNVA